MTVTSSRTSMRRLLRRSRLVGTVALGAVGLVATGLVAVGHLRQPVAAEADEAVFAPPAAQISPIVSPVAQTVKAPPISLGAGFLAFPNAASAWVQAHPDDPRATTISAAIAGHPSALWLTGDESFPNLTSAVQMARSSDRTMVLSIYDIPMRYDGLSAPTTTSLATYKHWINRVTTMIGTTRAVVVLEPDALWFYDRMPDDSDRATRMAALNYAVDSFDRHAPRSLVYLDAGTSSQSVAPDRMAQLLVQAGMTRAAGYAVNTSSYSPQRSIKAYAQAIRTALQAQGVINPRYVVDTGRNGAKSWNYTWCNPQSQRLGSAPRLLLKPNGLDMNLWIKAPGTSDGDCGPVGGGAGTYGGQFIPQLAYRMTTG